MQSPPRSKGKVLILSAEERQVVLDALQIRLRALELTANPSLSRSQHRAYLMTLINRLGYTEADLGPEN